MLRMHNGSRQGKAGSGNVKACQAHTNTGSRLLPYHRSRNFEKFGTPLSINNEGDKQTLVYDTTVNNRTEFDISKGVVTGGMYRSYFIYDLAKKPQRQIPLDTTNHEKPNSILLYLATLM